MGVKLKRKKDRNILLTIIYRVSKVLPFTKEYKLKLFLNLEWIFDRLAHEMSFSVYDADKHPFRKLSKEFILNKINKNHIVLDLGCKYGDISNYIAEKAKMVVGIDYDDKAILRAKSKYKRDNIIFEVGDAKDYLKKTEYKFDVLILSHIIEHLDNPRFFLNDSKMFFKYIYIEVPDFDRYYLNQYRLDKNIKLIYSDDDHIYEFGRNDLKELIELCGLRIIEEEYKCGIQRIWAEV